MNKSVIKTVNTRIDEILSTRNAELADAEKALADAKAAVASGQSRAEAATAATDVDGYCAACEDVEKATRSVEVYEKRLEQLRGNRLVSIEEDARTVTEIRTYQKDLQDKTTESIINLLSQIEDISQAYFLNQDEANRLIARWHNQVCQQPHPRGSDLPVSVYDLHAQDGNLRSAICDLVTNYFYRKQKGLAVYQGVGSIWTK